MSDEFSRVLMAPEHPNYYLKYFETIGDDYFDNLKHDDYAFKDIFKTDILPTLGSNKNYGGNIKFLYLYLTKSIWFLARPVTAPLFIDDKDEMEKHFISWEDEKVPSIKGFLTYYMSKNEGNSEIKDYSIEKKDFPDLLVILPKTSKFNKDTIFSAMEFYLNDKFLDLTEENFSNKEWIEKNLSGKNLAIYLECLSSCKEIVESFNKKSGALKAMNDFYRSSLLNIKDEFKKKFNFSSILIIRKHPYYGALYLEIERKQEKALSRLVLSSDKKLCQYIDSFPPEFKMICIRKVIGIENIINFCLDHYLSLK